MKIPGHKVYYEQATRNILARLKELNLSPEKYKRATDLVIKFRKAFTSDNVKKATFTTPDSDVWNLGYDSIGFCRVASISFAIAMEIAADWGGMLMVAAALCVAEIFMPTSKSSIL